MAELADRENPPLRTGELVSRTGSLLGPNSVRGERDGAARFFFAPLFAKQVVDLNRRPTWLPNPLLLAEFFSVVICAEIQLGAERHDARGIDLVVREIVVPLDVIEIHGLGDPRLLVQITQISL